jgi:hypothetical protein
MTTDLETDHGWRLAFLEVALDSFEDIGSKFFEGIRFCENTHTHRLSGQATLGGLFDQKEQLRFHSALSRGLKIPR